MIKIYKIVYEGSIIYIGKTILQLKKRKSLPNYSVPIDIYKKSTIHLIEETDDVSRERYWIDYYRSIEPKLMNKRGGDHSDQTRTEVYLKRLIESKDKKSFKKMTDDEKRKKRREYYSKNRDRLLRERRDQYHNGGGYRWKGSKAYIDMLKRRKEERGFIKKS